MSRYDDYVSLSADLCDLSLDCIGSGFENIVLNAFLPAIPDGYVRCDDSDYRNLHAIPVDDGMTCSHHISALCILNVCRKHGEVGAAEDFLHLINSPVELVVAQSHGIVTHEVHGFDHGVFLSVILVCKVI